MTEGRRTHSQLSLFPTNCDIGASSARRHQDGVSVHFVQNILCHDRAVRTFAIFIICKDGDSKSKLRLQDAQTIQFFDIALLRDHAFVACARDSPNEASTVGTFA